MMYVCCCGNYSLINPDISYSHLIIGLFASLFQVLGGCISGPEKLVTQVCNLHHVLGGTLNPVIHFCIALP